MVFNFFEEDKDVIRDKMAEYLHIDKYELKEYLNSIYPDYITVYSLCKKFEIDLKSICSDEVEIVSRHMTTLSDVGLDSIKTEGIFNLKEMLQKPSVLSRFLAEYKIKVDVDNRLLYINGKTYPILSSSEKCDTCYIGRDKVCLGYSKCELHDKISALATKLYYYGATLESFMYATLEDMHRYSTIDSCPEILDTLDNILYKAYGKYENNYVLCYGWKSDDSKKCYVLEFNSKISDMETYAPMDFDAAYYEIKDELQLSDYSHEDYLDLNISKHFWNNRFLIKKFLSIYFYDGEEYSSLLPGKNVLPGEIKVYEVCGKNMIQK